MFSEQVQEFETSLLTLDLLGASAGTARLPLASIVVAIVAVSYNNFSH